MNQNRKAFLDTISISEGTFGKGDNGYNVIVGGSLFHGYDDHPRQRIYIHSLNVYSTAAGRYQLLERYFDHYKALLGLTDFSPASQDAIALRQIEEFRGLPLIDAGQFDHAIGKCAGLWASLPGAGYGQRENKLAALRADYLSRGGQLA